MKKSFFSLALISSLFAVAATATAGDFSTSYVQAQYADMGDNIDGTSIKGSVAFGGTGLYLSGEYSKFDVEAAGVDLKESVVLLGYQKNVSNAVALFGEAGYYQVDVGGFDADGYQAGVGARFAAGKYFEPYVKVAYTDVDEIGGATEGTIGTLIKPWANVGFNAQYSFGEDSNADLWKAGVRFSW